MRKKSAPHPFFLPKNWGIGLDAKHCMWKGTRGAGRVDDIIPLVPCNSVPSHVAVRPPPPALSFEHSQMVLMEVWKDLLLRPTCSHPDFWGRAGQAWTVPGACSVCWRGGIMVTALCQHKTSSSAEIDTFQNNGCKHVFLFCLLPLAFPWEDLLPSYFLSLWQVLLFQEPYHIDDYFFFLPS